MEPLTGVSPTPLAVFRARTVRDAASLDRDGLAIFAIRRLSGGDIEILFEDGVWLLASPDDLSPVPD